LVEEGKYGLLSSEKVIVTKWIVLMFLEEVQRSFILSESLSCL